MTSCCTRQRFRVELWVKRRVMQAYVGGLAQLPAPDDQPLFQPPQSKKAKRKGLVNLAKGGKEVVQNVMKGVGLTPGSNRDETKPLVRISAPAQS